MCLKKTPKDLLIWRNAPVQWPPAAGDGIPWTHRVPGSSGPLGSTARCLQRARRDKGFHKELRVWPGDNKGRYVLSWTQTTWCTWEGQEAQILPTQRWAPGWTRLLSLTNGEVLLKEPGLPRSTYPRWAKQEWHWGSPQHPRVTLSHLAAHTALTTVSSCFTQLTQQEERLCAWEWKAL